MGRHACIVIGINGYQFLQPLSYAQKDAEALYQFLIESGFVSDQCFLLTDAALGAAPGSTYPSRENILDCLNQLCQSLLQSGDVVWCFFSGYGMSDGQQDYLIPIDGKSADLAGTSVSTQSVLECFKRSPAESVLVLMDINRSQGGQVGEKVGALTMESANQLEIPTILSCRPDQLSRETSALRQGFFTSALLEALRSGKNQSVEELHQFLSHRLPELTEQHLRPQQDPVLVMHPSRKFNQSILPDSNHHNGVRSLENQEQNGSVKAASTTVLSVTQSRENSKAILDLPLSETASAVKLSESPTHPKQSTPESTLDRAAESPSNHRVTPQNPTSAPDPRQTPEASMSNKSFLQQLILWSGLTALLLLFGVFYANRNILLNRSAQKSQPVSQNQPTAQSPSVPQPAPAPEPAQTPIASSGKPSTPQGSNPENDVILKQARAALQDSSASNWSNAIAVASQIPETDSLYATAQQEIERWSQAILDIAQGRASISNYPDAIAAARLVPNENQALYNQAQLQIQQWEQILQQVRNNQAQLKVARDKIKVGDPASYRSAIDAVSSIDPTQPGYAEVKQSIDQWSGAILEIAQAQAKKGRLTQAIESATLVPQNTPSAEAAKTAIAQWQSQLSQPKKN